MLADVLPDMETKNTSYPLAIVGKVIISEGVKQGDLSPDRYDDSKQDTYESPLPIKMQRSGFLGLGKRKEGKIRLCDLISKIILSMEFIMLI
jgi:hypothetical protein